MTNLRVTRSAAAEWRSAAMAESMRYETFVISACDSSHTYTPQGVNCKTNIRWPPGRPWAEALASALRRTLGSARGGVGGEEALSSTLWWKLQPHFLKVYIFSAHMPLTRWRLALEASPSFDQEQTFLLHSRSKKLKFNKTINIQMECPESE